MYNERMRAAFVLTSFALLACGDSLAPVHIGAEYQLRRINGQAIPWNPPDNPYIVNTVTEGSVIFLDQLRATRHEAVGRWVSGPLGDSVWVGGNWTYTADYERLPGKIVLTYLPFIPGSIGPSQRAETLYVAGRNALALRQTGMISPIDSMIRLYCASSC